MENQHRQIKGYRDLTQQEIDRMNRIKEQCVALEALIDDLTASEAAATGDAMRWIEIGRTHLQEGLMALTRAVAKPEGF